MGNTNILILGCNGFIGSSIFKYFQDTHNLRCSRFNDAAISIKNNLAWADTIIHAIGVSRSANENEFFEVNINFSKLIFDELILCQNGKKFIYFSSIHFGRNDLYGFSKRYNEFIFSNTLITSIHQVFLIRTPGIFGPGALPNNVSVVSTFCYNKINNIKSVITDESSEVKLLFIIDLIKIIRDLFGSKDNFKIVCPNAYSISVGNLYKLINSFSFQSEAEIDANSFEGKIFKTYNSFINVE